ncbi:MAG: hypothetical protein AB4372_22940 [Xenococcus sp. (in: cyanobacteria)]
MASVSQPLLTGPLTGTNDADTIYAYQSGMVDFQLDARGGDDTVNGTNLFDNGIGISSSVIAGGLGDDTLIGNATGVNSFGIVDSLIYGGEGDDVIIATGTSAGIQGAILVGGSGDDVFNVQSGFGNVVGETGQDLIILAGPRADYTFTPLDEVNTVIKVEGISNGTEIITAQLESFQFDDVTIPIQDIFI